ncbi:MAG: DUF3574 domain-containing protein [Afipia sp.]|nr:DUF3574 domain-containing protein [Afipia sp.]
MRCLFGLLAVIMLSGCASLPPVCMPPEQTMTTAEMYFGRNVGDRVGVSNSAFADFTAREITPRFPQGLTIVDARGQWRGADHGRVVREPSKVVLVTFTDSAEARANLAVIAEAYKRTFRQESVLTTVRASCATF